MKSNKTPASQSSIASNQNDSSSRFSKKWIWGAIGIASALALGVAASRRGLPFLSRRDKTSKKSALPTTLTTEWQLIEKIDRALQKRRIEGIDVYVKNGKILLVAAPEYQRELADARDLIFSIEGVQSVETSIKETSTSSTSAS